MLLLLTAFFMFLVLLYDFFFFFFFMLFFLYCFVLFNGGFFDGLFFSDYLSLVLMFVSLWIFVISFFATNFSLLAVFLFWLMFVFTITSFFAISFFYFYISFELVFVLLFFYLLSLGSTLERVQASFYMFFYTLFFSFPFLGFLLDYMCSYSDFFLFMGYSFCSDFFCYFMFIVFMVKLPIFSFHLWLIKAHVESPVSGSMVLAGVMLKIGGYGIIRFLYLLKDTSFCLEVFFSFIFYLGLVGSLFISVLCFRQMDLKMIIAYSSVVHMGMMFMGILSFTISGLYGSVIMMVSHGFISPLMFFLMNKLYVSLSSRSVMLLKGFILTSSFFCLFWFLSCVLNLGLPPFMSFFSEILIIGSMGSFTFLEWTFLFLICFSAGVYCIYSYVTVAHGSFVYYTTFVFSLLDFLVSVILVYFVLCYPLVFFVMFF